ncbi:DUF3817 domain-containing protein [Kangiella sp. HZ709]|uniref:DUF3817 domain-containing protein n=1 Tax=Kangiella sp. HZ709 TaxID=2666328 RepID=UPI0012B1200B|nr:DUF3817 domain-containing protein [Kangiella sp. HZ709]
MKYFRIISFVEGLSYLIILCVTFGLISRDYVFPLGAGHGALFILYLILSLQASHKQKWSIITWLLIFLASIVPFAFIVVDTFLKREILKDEAAQTNT